MQLTGETLYCASLVTAAGETSPGSWEAFTQRQKFLLQLLIVTFVLIYLQFIKQILSRTHPVMNTSGFPPG